MSWWVVQLDGGATGRQSPAFARYVLRKMIIHGANAFCLHADLTGERTGGRYIIAMVTISSNVAPAEADFG